MTYSPYPCTTNSLLLHYCLSLTVRLAWRTPLTTTIPTWLTISPILLDLLSLLNSWKYFVIFYVIRNAQTVIFWLIPADSRPMSQQQQFRQPLGPNRYAARQRIHLKDSLCVSGNKAEIFYRFCMRWLNWCSQFQNKYFGFSAVFLWQPNLLLHYCIGW